MESTEPILTPEEVKETSLNLTDSSTSDVNPNQSAVVVSEVEETVEPVAAEAADEVSADSDDPKTETEVAPRRPRFGSRQEVVAEAQRLAQLPADEISADDISHLKQQFYQLRPASENIALTDAGSSAPSDAPVAETSASADANEEAFKEALTIIKEKKAAARAEFEAQLQSNLEAKQAIIDRLREISSDADAVSRLFPEVRELQARFKEIGQVPQTAVTDIWRNYQDAVELFYDQLKVNKELRDYDFKKNLAEKEQIVTEARALALEAAAEEGDIVSAFRRLQELHDRWRAVGPVAKELREQLWTSFKEASSEINRRYQDFFVERKNRERENEDAKTAIINRLEALDFSSLSTYAAWDEMTARFMEAQAEWKTLGYASRRVNNELFSRFRALCDSFFAAKAGFYKQMKDTLSLNLEKKIALCERAEALKDSTDWRATADELTRLQKEWKSIGAVAKKHSDQVWHRFLAACDYFFEQKKKNTSGQRRNERANLEQKQAVIASLTLLRDSLTGSDVDRDTTLKAVKDLQAQWQTIGHVPYGEKDKVYDSYRAVVDDIYDRLNVARREGRMSSFESSIDEMASSDGRLHRERERLARIYEQRKSEIKNYENNLGFLTSRSKSGDSMVREMQRRVQNLRDSLSELESKIKAIDARL